MEKSRIRRSAWEFLGHLAMIGAILGFILPMVPAAPFAFFAGGFYAKGSERFHQALLKNRIFGKMVRDWEQERKVSRSTWLLLGVSLIITLAYFLWRSYR